MTMTNHIPATCNPSFGFWGTMHEHAETAWPLAMHAIATATQQPVEDIRVFLDSRQGRHFADAVQNSLNYGLELTAAIAAALERWMDWKIPRSVERDYGIPHGLPYLTGWVIYCAHREESEAT